MRYIVSCHHVAEAYRLNALALDVNAYVQGQGIMLSHREAKHGNPVEWYARIPRFGCGKSYLTAEAAIRGLLQDNGCTAITIAKVETVTLDAYVQDGAFSAWRRVAYTAQEAAAEYMSRAAKGQNVIAFSSAVELASPSEAFFDAYAQAIEAAPAIVDDNAEYEAKARSRGWQPFLDPEDGQTHWRQYSDRWAGGHFDAYDAKAACELDDDKPTAAEMEAAKALVAGVNAEIEIDADAEVSRTEDGAFWMQVRIRVPKL